MEAVVNAGRGRRRPRKRLPGRLPAVPQSRACLVVGRIPEAWEGRPPWAPARRVRIRNREHIRLRLCGFPNRPRPACRAARSNSGQPACSTPCRNPGRADPRAAGPAAPRQTAAPAGNRQPGAPFRRTSRDQTAVTRPSEPSGMDVSLASSGRLPGGALGRECTPSHTPAPRPEDRFRPTDGLRAATPLRTRCPANCSRPPAPL
jgi:hypothetical protein